jgi:NADPH:quinone reductase-like Zn-dependent oxidoreductase
LQSRGDRPGRETPDGMLVICGAGRGDWVGPLARVVKSALLSRFAKLQLRPLLAHREQSDLLVLKELIEAGKLRPVIDRTCPISQIREAIAYLQAGHAQGKVVVTM